MYKERARVRLPPTHPPTHPISTSSSSFEPPRSPPPSQPTNPPTHPPTHPPNQKQIIQALYRTRGRAEVLYGRLWEGRTDSGWVL